ncbi:serine protease [Halobacteriovorax sp. HLS]|uniref:trypsin-like serine peptidase n=1 Tax=Halobacteriovorax sp. HLS TaxID=2234000 RepID=UPI000FD7A9F8|nr:serine protease [Halobacteriovorax sp. HLS]
MKLLLVSVMFLTFSVKAELKVVYGTDGRSEVSASEFKWQKAAKSTAALVPVENLEFDAQKNVYRLSDKGSRSLGEGMNLCRGEKFYDQPNAAICSGFLIGKKTLITAGHCAKEQMANVCSSKKFVWVFDYNIQDRFNPTNMEIPAKNVTGCDRVIKAELDNVTDYAAIKLTKDVDRAPLKFRKSGKINNREKLVVIGVPWGLPTKVTTGGKVLYNDNSVFFSASVDTFQGNSGSAVFNERTGEVEGILVRGKSDGYSDERLYCTRVNVCNDNGKSCNDPNNFLQKAEDITRMPFVYKRLSNSL